MLREPSLSGLRRLSADFFFSGPHPRLQSWLAMVLIVLTMIFIFSWPTMAGAMSGYTPGTTSFVREGNGTLIRYSSFAPLAYVINDGKRANLKDGYIVLLWDTISSDGM